MFDSYSSNLDRATIYVMSRGGLPALLVLTAVLVTGCGTSVSAGPLAGTWHVHTYYLTINTNGSGSAKWPTHVTCGIGVGRGGPPCDKLGSNGQIIDAGRASLTLTYRSGDDGRGEVSGSTQTSVMPNGKVQLSLGANDVLYLRFAKPPKLKAYSYLCGTATDASLINCGA